MGNVVQEVKCPNVAREAALAAGIPNDVPCHTVTQAEAEAVVLKGDCGGPAIAAAWALTMSLLAL